MFVRVFAVSANECTCVSTCAVDVTLIACVTSKALLILRALYIYRENKTNYLHWAIEGGGLKRFNNHCSNKRTYHLDDM